MPVDRALEAASPLIMFEVKAEKNIDLSGARILKGLGYSIYRYLPALKCLIPQPLDEGFDSYQLNLFACKPDRAEALSKRKLLLPSKDRPEQLEETDGAWLQRARSLPCWAARKGMEDLAEPDSAEEILPNLRSALNHYAIFHDTALSLGERHARLQRAYELLLALDSDTTSILVLSALSRISLDLGKRDRTVELLRRLHSAILGTNALTPSPYFLPPSPRFDQIYARDKFREWAMAATIESQIQIRSYSSYFMLAPDADLGQEFNLLDALQGNPFESPEIRRRRQLLKLALAMPLDPEDLQILRQQSDQN